MKPLPFPAVLFIEPTNQCNFKCGVCPESVPDFREKAGYYQRMSEATWRRVYAELGDIYMGFEAIRFWGMGEPMLNPNLASMIQGLSLTTNRTELATNGSLLDRYAGPLLGSGLDLLRISVYGGTADYADNSGSIFQAKDILDQARRFRKMRDERGSKTPHITAQLMAPPQDVPEFIFEWSGVADDLSIDLRHNWGGSDQRLVSIGIAAPTTGCCPKPFRELYIKANGDVSVCCLDWDGQLVVGNVNRQSLSEIWNGPEIDDIRASHENGTRSFLSACRDCNFMTRDAQGNFL